MQLLILIFRQMYKVILRIPKPSSWNQALRRWASLSASIRRRAEFAQPSSPLNPLPVVPFWETSLAEPTVLLALKDFVRAGEIVLDVGANGGAIAIPLGRLVGIRGAVVAFEASPRIIPYLLDNLVKHHAINVTPVHRAVAQQSGNNIPIFAGTHLNDSIYVTAARPESPVAIVETIALDDYCAAQNISPRVIKMDIEGAEYDALLGAQHIIRGCRPKLILEQSAEDSRCFEWLSSEKYLAYDLAKYTKIDNLIEYKKTSPISNILYVHCDDDNVKSID
jgi:FkbM family methyltransferase